MSIPKDVFAWSMSATRPSPIARRWRADRSRCRPAARRLIKGGGNKKGDPIQAARLAGIMAAKKTSELIPLCHPLNLSHVSVDLTPTKTGYAIESRVRISGKTGVEMEALTAVAVAALTLYDMVKAVDKSMVIGDIELVEKKGGRSGHYRKSEVKS